MSQRLRTFDEWLSAKGIPRPPTKGFETSPIELENKIDFILKVIDMMNLSVSDDGLKQIKENNRDLFVKRDDVYYDDKRKMYFLKEDRPK